MKRSNKILFASALAIGIMGAQTVAAFAAPYTEEGAGEQVGLSTEQFQNTGGGETKNTENSGVDDENWDLDLEFSDGSGVRIAPSDEIEGIWDMEITLKDADTELAVPETIMLYRLNEETGELVEDMNAYRPGGTVYIPLLDWDVKSGTDYGRVWKMMNLFDIFAQEAAEQLNGVPSSREVSFEIVSGKEQVESISYVVDERLEEYGIGCVKIELAEDPVFFDEALSFGIRVEQLNRNTIFGGTNADSLPPQYAPLADGLLAQYLPEVLSCLTDMAKEEGVPGAEWLGEESVQEAVIEGRIFLTNPVILKTDSPVTLEGAGYGIKGMEQGQSYAKDSVIRVEAEGSGLDNDAPGEGAVRYLPARWEITKVTAGIRNGFWQEDGPFTIEETTEGLEPGEYVLTVEFDYQIYEESDGGWTTAQTIEKKTAFAVEGAPDETNPQESGNDGGGDAQKETLVQTADSIKDKETKKSPHTGDENSMWSILLYGGLLCIAGTGIIRVKSHRQKA